jgi:hypothetical protein
MTEKEIISQAFGILGRKGGQSRSGQPGESHYRGAKFPIMLPPFGDVTAMAINRHVAGILFDTDAPTAPQIRAAKERITQIAERLGGHQGKHRLHCGQRTSCWKETKFVDTKHTSRTTGKGSTPYSPKTGPEKAEAFKLLGQLENELAKEEALREGLVKRISGRAKAKQAGALPKKAT